MATRKILQIGEEVLTKKCRAVEKIDERILTLLDDMKDTLVEADGVGLAAPQVGVLRRVVIVDLGDKGGIVEMINPEIVSCEGENEGIEGCLSVAGKNGITKRPNKVTLKALDRHGKEFTITGEGPLNARCFCHEVDHLNGKLFVEHVIRYVDEEE